MVAYSVDEVTEFVQQFFLDDEKASIHACVRDALDLGIPVTPDQVSGIRRTMRQQGVTKLSLVPPRPAADKPPVGMKVGSVSGYARNPPQPPQWFIDKQKREDELFLKLQAEELPSDEPPMQKKAQKAATDAVLERRRYFEGILLDDPMQTVVAAMTKVKVKFGTSVDPGFAVRTLRLVRELAGVTKEMVLKRGDSKPLTHRINLPEVKVNPPPAPVVPRPLSKEPPKAATEEEYLLRYQDSNGTVGETTRIISKRELEAEIQKLTMRGVAPIRVFKEVKMKTTVTVNVSFE